LARHAALCLTVLAATPVMAQEAAPTRCQTPATLLDSPYVLPRVRARLTAGEPLRIVALGSSSTEGAGAVNPYNNYPNQLRTALQRMFPRSRIAVLNRGVGGEDTPAMLARFQRDVLAERPDLLIWQAGTNMALRDGDPAQLVDELEQGIRLARAAGIDVMLMDSQRAPRYDAKPYGREFLRRVNAVAELNRVPLIQRNAIMTHWLDTGQFTMDTMIHPDGLHMVDASYICLGRAVARMIARQAPVPIAAAQ
jgi:lysophospholipase L1-like esterase